MGVGSREGVGIPGIDSEVLNLQHTSYVLADNIRVLFLILITDLRGIFVYSQITTKARLRLREVN